MDSSQVIRYPAGAKVRVRDIVSDPKRGTRGLLPISKTSWYRLIAEGKVPAGEKLGERLVVWPIEVVLNVGQREAEAA